MRRRRCNRFGRVVTGLGCLLAALEAGGQRSPVPEGGLFVLLPIGAQTAGQGEAIAASQIGSEAVWWNPAGLARSEKREIAIHHAQTIFATGDAITIVVPSDMLGVIALSVHILDFGDLERTIGPGGSIGEILPRGIVYGATYGTTLGGRIGGGVTYKVLQFRVDCRGECGELPPSASTSALDFGLQLELSPAAPVSLGVVVRNIGLDFQVNDEEQADPLPTRIQAGMQWRVARLVGLGPGMELSVSGDVVNRLELGSPSARVGAAFAVDSTFQLRAGYSFEESENAGPSIGVGVAVRRIRIDLARIFESFSTQAGQAPTFISLRYFF